MDVQDKLLQLKQLQNKMNEMEQKMHQTNLIEQQVHGFFEQGLLKNNERGDIEVVENRQERAQIREVMSSKKKLDRRDTHNLDHQSQNNSQHYSAQELDQMLAEEEGLD